jgi:guanosine-3',5'-bis(diphosphate) 3'-pyrophosphohydrolase
VAEVTDDKKLPKAERKRLQIEHAVTASDAAKQLKIADKICNVRDIANNPPEDWPDERKADYLDWATRVVGRCRGINTALERAYEHALAIAREKLGMGRVLD